MINIVKQRKIYFMISGAFVLASLIFIFTFGLKLGIDFTGGSLMEISVGQGIEANTAKIKDILTGGDAPLLESVQIQPTGESGFVLRFKDISQDEHEGLLEALYLALAPEGAAPDASEKLDNPFGQIQGINDKGETVNLDVFPVDDQGNKIEEEKPAINIDKNVLAEERFESIGPIIGEELQQKAVESIIAVLIAIILYMAWAFRKVSEPVSSWKYGITAVIALAHDVIIPTGVFAVLGRFMGVEVDILFVTALLTILGFSVNDTIVVFDRTRENLARERYKHDFDYIVNKSVNETIRRSVNTSLTAFVVLLAIFLYGGETVKYFVLALMIGIVFGTYSSIFLASPLLVEWEKRRKQ